MMCENSSKNRSDKNTYTPCGTVYIPQRLSLNNSPAEQQARYVRSSSIISSLLEIKVG